MLVGSVGNGRQSGQSLVHFCLCVCTVTAQKQHHAEKRAHIFLLFLLDEEKQALPIEVSVTFNKDLFSTKTLFLINSHISLVTVSNTILYSLEVTTMLNLWFNSLKLSKHPFF